MLFPLKLKEKQTLDRNIQLKWKRKEHINRENKRACRYISL